MSTLDKAIRLAITTLFTCLLVCIVLLVTRGLQWMVIHTYTRVGMHDKFFLYTWLFNTYIFMVAHLFQAGVYFVDGFRRSGICDSR